MVAPRLFVLVETLFDLDFTMSTSLEWRFTQLEEYIRNLEGRFTQLEEYSRNLEGRITQLEGRNTQLEGRITQLEAHNRDLDNKILLMDEQLQLAWPITYNIYRSHLIKGASRVLFWGQKNKIERRLSPTEVTFIDTLLDEFRNSPHDNPVRRAIILFCDEMAGKTPVPGSIEGSILARVKEQVIGGLLYPMSLPGHLATLVPTHYPSSFAGFIDNSGFMSILRDNVSLVFMPT